MKLAAIILLSLTIAAFAEEDTSRELCGCGFEVKCRHHWQDIYDYEIIEEDECDEAPPVVCPPDSCCTANTTYSPPPPTTNLTTVGSGNCTCNCSCECFVCSCSCNCIAPNLTVTPPPNNTNTTNHTCHKTCGKSHWEEAGLNLAEEHGVEFEELENPGGN